MSEPKIARRCPSCGASIRERAFFCPQCGNTLEQKPGEAADAVESNAETSPKEPEYAAIRSETAAAKESGVDDVIAAPLMASASARHTAVQGARDRVHRATAAARDVFEDDVLHRVEKLRKISSVVLDEAAYDPSLRFVLVAAALFVLFLLILLLSKLIG